MGNLCLQETQQYLAPAASAVELIWMRWHGQFVLSLQVVLAGKAAAPSASSTASNGGPPCFVLHTLQASGPNICNHCELRLAVLRLLYVPLQDHQEHVPQAFLSAQPALHNASSYRSHA
jgi:hypothetical protein